MDAGAISQVRRFNRIVTQRVGALNDRFLSRDARSARRGCSGRSAPRGVTCVPCELSSGSTRDMSAVSCARSRPRAWSRSVRRGRTGGFGSPGDPRERGNELCSINAATSWPHPCSEPLRPQQRARLVAAMAEVERLLTAAMVEVAPIDPADPRARYCMTAYFAELDRRFDAGFDPARSISADDEELRPPAGLLLVALTGADPVGCGALKLHDDAPVEVKRMWVAEAARGIEVGRRLLEELEHHAIAHGANVARLETNETLTEAIEPVPLRGLRRGQRLQRGAIRPPLVP